MIQFWHLRRYEDVSGIVSVSQNLFRGDKKGPEKSFLTCHTRDVHFFLAEGTHPQRPSSEFYKINNNEFAMYL